MALKDWIRSQFNGAGINEQGQLPDRWKTPMAAKTFWYAGPGELDPNCCTVIGGICSLATAESEAIRHGQITFASAAEFERWITGWYPRFDQVHNAVGIPPKSTREVIYVCEDSLFAARVALSCHLPLDELISIFRETHRQSGHPAIVNWLRNGGYQGLVNVVYTSELDRELKVGVRIWETMIGIKVQPKYRSTLKVGLMYTGLWPAILGITGPALIYEPIEHLLESPLRAAAMTEWLRDNPYGAGVNRQLFAAGFIPCYGTLGETRDQRNEQVINRSNWTDPPLPDQELAWAAANFLFARRDVALAGPEQLPPVKVKELVARQLQNVYGS